jgi:hypothetical protein
MPQPYYARPTSSFGYWRGGMSDGPLWQNQGSYRYGPAAQGAGLLPPGAGPAPSAAGWSPTVTYMLALVVVEMVLFKVLEMMLR